MSPDHVRETNLLGAALTFRTLLDLVTIDPDDFADPRHAALWQLMVDMREKGRTVDPATVLGALGRIPAEDRVGIDGPFLHSLVRAAPSTRNEGELAARDVTNNAVNRRLGLAGTRIAQVSSAGGDALENQQAARDEIDAAGRAISGTITTVGETIDATLDGLENPSRALPTPWPDLNHFMRGWSPSTLTVIGARPSVGKSIVLLQAAIAATEHGWVSFHSLEMGHDDLNARVLAQVAEVPLGRLLGKTDNPDTHLTATDYNKIAKVRGRIGEMRLAVDVRPEVTLTDIKAHARQVARRGPLAAIFVDYIQLMHPVRDMRNRPRQEQVASYSRGLKVLAKDLDVPVVAAVQLNREVEGKPDTRPTMAHIRESGSIEQDADNILLLHSESKMTSDLELILAKQRQGPLGIVELERQGHYARMTPRQWYPHRNDTPHPAYADN